MNSFILTSKSDIAVVIDWLTEEDISENIPSRVSVSAIPLRKATISWKRLMTLSASAVSEIKSVKSLESLLMELDSVPSASVARVTSSVIILTISLAAKVARNCFSSAVKFSSESAFPASCSTFALMADIIWLNSSAVNLSPVFLRKSKCMVILNLRAGCTGNPHPD